MRYRKKEIGCEVKYSELDLRAISYIEEFEEKEKTISVHNEEDEQLQRKEYDLIRE